LMLAAAFEAKVCRLVPVDALTDCILSDL
jgi:hypothetical protein